MSKNIALLYGTFHTREMQEMLDEARIQALTLWLQVVKEVWVPGSMEKPLALKRLFEEDSIDGVAVLGIIENGETQHWFVMGQSVYSALIQLQLDYNKPIGMGILGPGIQPSQIPPRVRPYAKAAVRALHEMLS